MLKKRYKVIILLTITFSFTIFILGFQFFRFLHSPLPVKSGGHVFVFSQGASVHKMVKQLSEEGVLQSPTWFLIWIRYEGFLNNKRFQAGEYLIKPGTTPVELINQLQEGRVIQHALTVIPGWNFDRLMAEIHQSPKLKHTLVGLTAAEIMTKLGFPGVHPEGHFFPETYYFTAGTTDVILLQRAYNLLQKKLSLLWSKRAKEILPLKSPYEALILASIIEKESNLIEEYTEIAGVYIRRLQKNMPLQADPTVIYGLGKSFTGELTIALLKSPTPYNTYQRLGLPPTPIALPGEKALEAAMYPKPGETLYFVAKAGGKGHVFSKTLKEHHSAVIQYRNYYKKKLLGS